LRRVAKANGPARFAGVRPAKAPLELSLVGLTLENFIDQAAKRNWFLFEASRKN